MSSGIKIDELFYELEVRTSGVKGGIDDAERSLGRFSQFIKANPMAAVAALGVAIVATGAKAAQMAADVERAGRRIETVFPGITKEAKALSNEFGVAQEGVVRLFDTIERNGERTRSGLQTTARAALQLNQALGGTPEDLQAIAGSLDQVLDLFHLSGDEAGRVAAQLFNLSKGRVPVSELADAFRASASTIRDNNLSLEEAAAGLVKLLEAGLPARQAASALADEIAKGRDNFRDFVGPVDDSTAALKAFDAQVQAMGESADVTNARLHERLNNSLIDLGNHILPTVNKNLENTLTLLDHLSGRSGAFDDLERIADLANTERTRGAGRGLSARQRNIASRTVQDLDKQLRDGDISFGELSQGQLQDLKRNLEALGGVISDPKMEAARVRMIEQLQALTRAGAPQGAPGPRASTPDQLAAGQRVVTELQKSLADLTGDLAAQTSAALAAFRDKVAEQAKNIPPEQAAEFQRLTDQIIAQYQQRIRDIRSGVQAMRDLDLPAPVPLTTPTTPAQRRQTTQDLLRGIPSQQDEATRKFIQRVDDVTAARERARAEAEKELKATIDTARFIDQAVQGALDLATAFKFVDEATAGVLSNISQVATGIEPMMQALDNLKAGTGGIGAVIGTALPVLGGIASIASTIFGGESDAEKAMRAALERTADRIEELTKELGNLGQFAISGTQVSEGLAGIARFSADPDGFRRQRQGFDPNSPLSAQQQGLLHGLVNQKALDAALAQSGSSRAELQALADSLGLEVNFSTNNFSDLEKAFKALNAALREAELTKFAKTFAGQLDALHARFEIFDITDPIAQLQQLVALQGRTVTNSDGTTTQLGSSSIANAFQGLDLNTQAGQDEATKRLQALFEQLNSADQLTPEQQAQLLGGLTGQQFLDALLQLEALLDQAKQQGADETGVTSNFSVEQTITRAEAGQMVGVLTTIDTRVAELVEVAKAQLAVMGGGLAVSAAVAAIPPAAGASYGGDSIVIEKVEVTAPEGTSDPAAWGQAAGQAMTRELGDLLRKKRQLAGDPTGG